MNEVKQLTKSQKGFLAAIRQKHNAAFEVEFRGAVQDIAEELGLGEEFKAGKVQLQVARDYSSLTVLRPPAMPAPKIPGKIKK